MTPETARILAQALKMREEAEHTLLGLLAAGTPPGGAMKEAAELYVHEQRIINAIIHEARDD